MPNEYIYQFDGVFDFDDDKNNISSGKNKFDNIRKYIMKNIHKKNGKIIKNDNLNNNNQKGINTLISENIDNKESNEDNIDIDENNINNEKDIGDSEFNYSVHTYFTRRKNNYTEENE